MTSRRSHAIAPSRSRSVRNAAATQRTLVEIAKDKLKQGGFESVSCRDIGVSAGLDAALIHRYFGGKEGLFRAVLADMGSGLELLEGDRSRFGRRAAALILEDGSNLNDGARIVLQSLGSERTHHLLEATLEHWTRALSTWINRPHAHARQSLAAALLLGIVVQGDLAGLPDPDTEDGNFLADRLAKLLQAIVDE